MKVSVVIAARDAQRFIHTALESALAQTLADLEVVVVDDGSADSTAKIVREFQQRDPRVVLLQSRESRGVSAARNLGLSLAKGEWIAVLDADDAFAVNRLDRLIAHAETRSLDALADNLLLKELDSDRPDRIAYPAQWMATERLLRLGDLLDRDRPYSAYQSFGYIKPILKKSFIDRVGLSYDETVWCAEDFLLYAHALLAGARFGVLNDPLYISYWRAGSLSGDSLHFTRK